LEIKIVKVMGRMGFVRKGRQQGQGIVEFTLALPVVLMLLLGIIEFGRFMIAYIAISSASREAARYGAAVGDYDSTNTRPYEDCTGILDAAKRVADAFLEIDDSNISIQYDKGPGTTSYSSCPPGAESVQLGDRIIVQITITYETLVPIGIDGINVISESRRTIMKNIVVD
jgi:Flp pilus assembly protein TadG